MLLLLAHYSNGRAPQSALQPAAEALNQAQQRSSGAGRSAGRSGIASGHEDITSMNNVMLVNICSYELRSQSVRSERRIVNRPGELDGALYKESPGSAQGGIGYAEEDNGTADVEGSSLRVRCKVVGGDITFGTGRRAVLRPVPLLMGCYADSDSAHDLPEYQGKQSQVSCADACFGTQYFGLQMRGHCYCGDSYGRYGVKLPNITAGLTGRDGTGFETW
eukprot:Skav220852  [mRNA]  locus=scaffold1888:525342:532413:- [translate_table: standard]